MNAEASSEQSQAKTHVARGVIRWLVQITVLILIQAVCLFLSAGSLAWAMGWVYVGVQLLNQAIGAIVLISINPQLLADRAQSQGPRDLDRVLSGVMFLYGPIAILIVAGLDHRFGWSPALSAILQIGAVVVALLGVALGIWAIASNRHFYGVFRIDKERGHTVISNGPYALVRHPGYLGGILFYLATALMLGSLWSIVPATLTVIATIVRTSLEDQALQRKLEGYTAYTQQTKYRLMPGIW
jgi:protein-S-isoprenylcysteine O-methyltransferase Ste14